MKIAIDIRAVRGNRSGVGFFTYNLIKALPQVDAENQYLLYGNRDLDLSFVQGDNFSKRIREFPVSNLWLQTGCPADLRRMGVDLFHGTNFVVPLISSVRRVVTVYDLTCFLFPKLHKWRNNTVQRLLPASIRRSERVIAVSEHTRDDLIRLFDVPPEKVKVIYGAAGEEFRVIRERDALEAFRRKHRLPERFILFVGTLEPRKNLVNILEALGELVARGIRSHKLVVVGERGWQWEPIFEKIDQRRLHDYVEFVGYQGWDVLPYYYNLADLLLYPSLYEGFGLPPLEAMACGTPSVVSSNSSLSEVVGEVGMKVDPADPGQIASAAHRLLEDRELYDGLVRGGLERARGFSWKQYARRTLEVYREACSG